MIEYHILPKHDRAGHICASTCPCKPDLRSEEDAGKGNRTWQHKDPKLAPPIMAGGLMDGRAWTLFAVANE